MTKQNYTAQQQLLEKYRNGSCSPDEIRLVEHSYNEVVKSSVDEFAEPDYDSLRQEIWNALPMDARVEVRPVRFAKIWTAAAAAIAIVVFGVWFFNQPAEPGQFSSVKQTGAGAQKIIPGKNGATITLANGKVIQLSDLENGVVIGDSTLAYANGGTLPAKAEELSDEQLTASTTKGQTYVFTLPDGTKVWLNADSKISFSKTQLVEGSTRRLILEGEAYFEVASDKNRPFIVQTDRSEVEVLGTHFNVCSYADDEVQRTTLLEGSVRLSALGISKVLKPGQQGKLQHGRMTVAEVDTDVAVSWKNNEFVFESENIDNVMKAVERWYNVEVIYVGAKTNERFSGGVSRYDDVSKVLAIVEQTGASHFEIKGRKIYVSK